MAAISKMMALGTRAPRFNLPDTVSGRLVSLEVYKSDTATVVMFLCNHCPYVKHVNNELVKLANDYISEGIRFIAISSNDVDKYPEDAPDRMKANAEKLGYPFPYLFDETQEVARAYDAACTPDFYIFNGDLELVYRGQLDDSRPGNDIPVTGSEIRAALDAILAGNSPDSLQKPSMGCSIKWKM